MWVWDRESLKRKVIQRINYLAFNIQDKLRRKLIKAIQRFNAFQKVNIILCFF